VRHVSSPSGWILLPVLVAGGVVFGHEGRLHSKKNSVVDPQELKALAAVNEIYLKAVKPIFERKCFDCHTSQTKMPWYSKLPGIKRTIEADIREGRRHIDMGVDFPFVSHASSLEDLDAIERSIATRQMPPLRYRLLHPSSTLTENEAKAVRDWVRYGKSQLDTK
jgi:hypothetical protein